MWASRMSGCEEASWEFKTGATAPQRPCSGYRKRRTPCLMSTETKLGQSRRRCIVAGQAVAAVTCVLRAHTRGRSKCRQKTRQRRGGVAKYRVTSLRRGR